MPLQQILMRDSESDDDAVQQTFTSASIDSITKHRKNLREIIHPNEWNNIPACIRSAIMELIDFND